MILILFGAPGVGKGTQALILAQKLGVAHLSTGDAFRAAIKNQTEVGRIAQGFVDAGSLVPDEIVARIVEEAMKAPEFNKGCILDGFPRTRGQAEALKRILTADGKKVDKVINLEVDDETIVDRLLQRGRADDTAEVIQHRLDVYRQETEPLLEYYSGNGTLVSINGIGEVGEITNRILDTLK